MGIRAPRGTERSTGPPLVGAPSLPALVRGPGRLSARLALALALGMAAWAMLPGASLAPAVPDHAVGLNLASVPALSGVAAPLSAPARVVRSTFPFAPPHGLRRPRAAEDLPSLYADGLLCSTGCRAATALAGWPVRPFDEQHPLRAGINELRRDSLHVGVDIQVRDGSAVYSLQAGPAVVLARRGPDARVQVGSFIYWHITPLVHSGQEVVPFVTKLGTVMRAYGHLAFSEVDAAGRYVNPLRPAGRVLVPWIDRAAPVIAHPSLAADGTATVAAFDPQSDVQRTTYLTPVLAPSAMAFRLYDRAGDPVTPLRFAFRGTHLLPWLQRADIYTPAARAPGFSCFASRPLCRPEWVFWLAGGLAAPLPTGLAPGRYRLTVYAWDWADNRRALDTEIRLTAHGWRPRGHVPRRPRLLLGRAAPPGLRPAPPQSLRQIFAPRAGEPALQAPPGAVAR